MEEKSSGHQYGTSFVTGDITEWKTNARPISYHTTLINSTVYGHNLIVGFVPGCLTGHTLNATKTYYLQLLPY